MGCHDNEKPNCFVAPLVLKGSHIWGVLFRPNVLTQHCLLAATLSTQHPSGLVIAIIQKHFGS